MPQGRQAICYSIIIVSNGKGITKVPSLTKLNLTFPQLFLMSQCHQWGNNRLISQETVEKRTRSVKENINFNTLTRRNLFKGCMTFHLKANIATNLQYNIATTEYRHHYNQPWADHQGQATFDQQLWTWKSNACGVSLWAVPLPPLESAQHKINVSLLMQRLCKIWSQGRV